MTDALVYLMDNIYIRFGSKLYRQNVEEIPMGTNCAPLVADLFPFCYERDFMKSLTEEKQYDMIDAFNSTSRYLDDLLNVDNIYFHMVHRIYPAELQLNKANASDNEAAFLDLNLSIHNDTVSTKIYDKRDDFDFDIVKFPFLDGDVPRRPSYTGVNRKVLPVLSTETHIPLHAKTCCRPRHRQPYCLGRQPNH